MSKLVLKFESTVLQEVAVGQKEVSIGRSPENGIVIDNPAVSNYHARVFTEDGRLMLQDFGSLNGTFVNGQRVKMIMLKPGDSVTIGKHTIVVTDSVEVRARSLDHVDPKPAVPKMNETVMLDTKDRRAFLEQIAAVGESAQPAPGRLKIPTLVVRNVKLQGWFKPKAAAQINRKDDNSYYIGAADKTPSVNGEPITHPTKLASGDLIEVAGVELEFVVRD
jgi:pSer/pThr/pTyr-binding forkhead associated (FHA) protein